MSGLLNVCSILCALFNSILFFLVSWSRLLQSHCRFFESMKHIFSLRGTAQTIPSTEPRTCNFLKILVQSLTRCKSFGRPLPRGGGRELDATGKLGFIYSPFCVLQFCRNSLQFSYFQKYTVTVIFMTISSIFNEADILKQYWGMWTSQIEFIDT